MLFPECILHYLKFFSIFTLLCSDYCLRIWLFDSCIKRIISKVCDYLCGHFMKYYEYRWYSCLFITQFDWSFNYYYFRFPWSKIFVMNFRSITRKSVCNKRPLKNTEIGEIIAMTVNSKTYKYVLHLVYELFAK